MAENFERLETKVVPFEQVVADGRVQIVVQASERWKRNLAKGRKKALFRFHRIILVPSITRWQVFLMGRKLNPPKTV